VLLCRNGSREELAIMSKANMKKNLITAVLSVLCAGTMLAGCDDVVATPDSSFYNEVIMTGNTNAITNNTMKRIYDAVVTEGDTNSAKVLNNILLIYSESIFGKFYGTDGLYEAVKKGDISKFTDKTAYPVFEGNSKKVMAFYYMVYDKIEESFLSYIKNSSYQERSIFHEKKFYDTQVKAYYKLGTVTDYKVKQVVGDIRITDHYEGSAETIDGVYFNDLFVTYESYIQDQLIPDIYRTMLVSQYLYKENYLALGNSYARKVDFIKLAEGTKDYVSNLVRAYTKDVIAAGKDMKKYGFDFLGNLYKGTVSVLDTDQQALAETIYNDANWTATTYAYQDGATAVSRVVRNETTLGGYLTDFMKLYNSHDRQTETEVESIRKTFTNSGAYSILTGLHIQEQSLIATDETTHNWYTTGAIDALPTDYSKRLFKGPVASNGVDKGYDEATKSYKDTDLSNLTGTVYGAYVKNNYYLVSKNPQSGDAYPYIIKDGTNFYLVMVNEAVNASKLGSTTTENYDGMAAHTSDALYGGIYTEYIARQVAYNMASSETYKSSSNQHWVEQMAINYHDTTIYNYFKKTFPDLFD
jgi:hypothetical protein